MTQRFYFCLFLLVALFATIFPRALAARRYDGAGPGSSTIGTGGDYATLHEAAADFAIHPLAGGNWEFLISEDLHERGPVTFSQNTGNYEVTVRPAPGVQATIDFAAADQGFLVTDGPTRSTHNFKIDGSNVPGTSSRDLTLTNAMTLVGYVGNCHRGHVRNCRIGNCGGRFIPYILAPVSFGPYWAAQPGTAPSEALVENCEFQNVQSNQPAIFISGSLSPALENVTIKDNIIVSGGRAVLLDHVREALITGNRIAVRQNASTYPIAAVLVWDKEPPYVQNRRIIIEQNRIEQLGLITAPETQDIAGILIDTHGKGDFYVIRNNQFGGLKLLASDEGTSVGGFYAMKYMGESDATLEVVHNSVDMLASDHPVKNLSPDNCFGFGVTHPGFSGKVLFQNNIVRVAQPGGACLTWGGGSGTWSSDHNILFADGGAIVGRWSGQQDMSDLKAWQAATGQDTHSYISDPTRDQGPHRARWLNAAPEASDLHWTAEPPSQYYMPRTPDTDSDLEKRPRRAKTAAGSYEIDAASDVTDWSVY